MINNAIDYIIGDGITHLNVYSKAKTELGRMLSNFYECQIMTYHGVFNSVEGYYHYLGLSPDVEDRDSLRELSGYRAVLKAEELKSAHKSATVKIFQDCINNAVSYKMNKCQDIILKDPKLYDLPLTHYIIVKQTQEIYDYTEKYKWWLDNIDRTRKEILERNGIVL